MKKSKPRDENVNTDTMNRREFLTSGLMATALATAGRLPLLSAESGDSSGIDASTGPCAVKPIRDHLKRFSPSKRSVQKYDQYSLTYDIIHWTWIKGERGTYANSVIGQVTIIRKAANGRVIYEITQQIRVGGIDNSVEARIICNTDNWNSLRKWTLRSYYTPIKGGREPLSELVEKGRCNDERIQIESGNYEYGFNVKNPVIAQWIIPDMLIRKANPALNITFDLLQDLSLFKPDHSLSYDGPVPVKLKDGKTITLQAYAHTGQGILPIHYMLDDQGHPQLITSSILS
ncbi:MAG: hypothetical protein ACYS80_23425, partial [Planctomycetota bacterium]